MHDHRQQKRGSPPLTRKNIPPPRRPAGERRSPVQREAPPDPVNNRRPPPATGLKEQARKGARRKSRRRRSPKNLSPRRRKWKMWLLYTLMVIAVLGVGIALSLTVLFKIETIEVAGDTRYTAEQIIGYSGIEKGQNLFLCDSKTGKENIMQNLPYIEDVQVRRSIPSKIVIEVTEGSPAGTVEFSGRFIVISRLGKVLEETDAPVQGLPLIRGLELTSAEPSQQAVYKDEDTRKILEDITNAIGEAGLDKISEIDLTKRTSPRLLYDGRIRIMLGQPSDLNLKLRFAMQILTKLEPDARGILDVSVAKDTNRGYFRPDDSVGSVSEPATEQEPDVSSVPEPEVSSAPESTIESENTNSPEPVTDEGDA